MFKKIIVFLISFFIIDFAFGQGGGFPVDPPGALTAPIDGGLSLLLAAGAAYGAKKVYDFRSNDGQEDEEMK
ncbi:hypothetical protein WAF17_06900 [Bernardetia sp. ABR2-2B]|uniref:PID-CTERM protein-sorting domain-containing protein n=1 Tax=Bernardetia sp. ABR2-2B TaxID=3127472 RepID=UPI0030D25E14